MKYPYHTLYHLKHFQVYSSAVLSTFMVLSNQSPGRLFFLPNWNSARRYTTSPCPLPQALVTSSLLSDGTTLTPLGTPRQWAWARSPALVSGLPPRAQRRRVSSEWPQGSRSRSSLRLSYCPLYAPHFVHPSICQRCSPCFVNHVAVDMGVQTSPGFHSLPHYHICELTTQSGP